MDSPRFPVFESRILEMVVCPHLLFGIYLFGDFCSRTIWALREIAGASPVVVPAVSSGLSVVSFAELLAGEVFVVNFGGTLHRIIPAP